MMIGTTVSHYRITAKLGEGGMGEVYRAHDERLDRDVAIKVLPEEVAQDEARLARFEREAKLLASLNHTNIATLHGLEEHEGQRFLVMELAEGETLAERIKKGAIPVDDALPIALQIAEGLEAAHEQGIIHRDLKPANVMLSPEGKVKILDFGLAKAWAPDEGDADLTHSPTLTAQMTAAGVLLGTAAYMSPEQARGKPVDKRADIWAFGCCLYEMFAGKRLFGGETVSDVLASVLREEPDWAVLPSKVALPVRGLLARCLDKDPRSRLQHIGEARILLEGVATAPAIEEPSKVGFAPARRMTTRVLPWALTAILAGTLIALLAFRERPETVETPALTAALSVELSDGDPLPQDGGAAAVPSPDGRFITFVAGFVGTQHLYLRALGDLGPRLLSGTEGAVSPFFSPDGQWVGFFSDPRLKKVNITGGAPVIVCGGALTPRGGTWSTSGDIVLTPSVNSPLYRVRSEGGTLEPVTELDGSADERSHRWPHAIPDSDWVLFLVQHYGNDYEDGNIEAVNLATGERRLVYRGGAFPVYSRSGHLLFARGGTLFAAPFDAERIEVSGEPRPVVENLLSSTGDQQIHDGSAQIAIGGTGLFAYRLGEPTDVRSAMVLVDRQGKVTPVLPDLADSTSPRFSPDGSRIALIQSARPGSDLWVFDRDNNQLSRLSAGTAVRGNPIWTPDGERITFCQATEGESLNIYWMRADGTGGEELLLAGDQLLWPGDWSPDGRTLLFYQYDPGTTDWDLLTLRLPDELGGQPTVQEFLRTPALEFGGVFSPDGRWVAFMSNESGQNLIYVARTDDPDRRWRVSDLQGRYPRWPRDSSEIFFKSGNRIISVTVSTERNVFRIVQSREIVAGTFQAYSGLPGYDVSPEGQQVVMFQSQDPSTEAVLRHVVIQFNGFEELKRLVPTE
jgi:serine/threonine-protein kinase